VIWQSQPFVPPLEEIKEYIPPNIVFTAHRWWKHAKWQKWEFETWTIEEISYITMEYMVEIRRKLNVPFWLGEFGAHRPFDFSNPEWLLTEQLLFRSEEQVISWNLWMGQTGIDKPWNAYLPFFPLKTYNVNLARIPWNISLPKLTDYVVDQRGVDRLESYTIRMWHNGDYVTFNPGINIAVIIEYKLPNGSYEVANKQEIFVTEQLTIRNEEGTIAHPGDWNIIIYVLPFT